MMMRTCAGHYINLDRVRELRFHKSHDQNKFEAAFTYDNGDNDTAMVYATTRTEVEEAFDRKAFLIPAEPGYQQLMFFSNEPGPDDDRLEIIDRWPVIAWELELEFGYHRPVTVWSCLGDADADNVAVLCPDGRVVNPGTQTWANEADWLKDQRKIADDKAAAKKRRV